MPQSLRTSTGQFSSSGGTTQLRASNARAVEPASSLPGSERGNLYMLVEVSGGGHAALYRQILNAAQTAFYEASGSQSAALTRAVRSAHGVLVRANEGLPEAAWRAGVNFAALQGQELTIAQAGPAVAMVSHPKTVDQFPGQLDEVGVPLGGPERPEVKLFHTTIEPRDVLLLAESGWLQHVSPDALAVVATANKVAVAQDYLTQLAGDTELSALIVGFGLDEGSSAVGAAAGGTGAEDPAAESDVGKAGTAAGLGGWFKRRQRNSEAETDEESAATAAVEPPPASEPQQQPVMAAPVSTVVPDEPEDDFEELPAPPRRSIWPLVIALLIIPLLIAGLVFAMWWVRSPRVAAQFQQTLGEATTILDEIDATTDLNAAVQRLPAAQELLDKAAAMYPNDARLEALRNRYQDVSDRVQQVEPLYGVVPIWDFNEEGQNLTRVVVGGDSVYVLDKGRNEVSRLILSSLGDSATPADPSPVIKKAQPVDDHVVSDLQDMTWVEGSGSQRSRLVVLDTSGGLLGFDSTFGASSLELGGQDKWQRPELMLGYQGKLYLVDPNANQIWRYLPGENGYEGDPEQYFPSGSPTDLTGVRAIAIDGSVWLLFPDGRLLKFLVGEAQPFIPNGPPGTPSSPVDLAVPLDGDRLYVADAGTGRILEYSKEGNLNRQFRPREGNILSDVRSLYLDEAAGALYILTGNRLYKANLPDPGPVTAPTT